MRQPHDMGGVNVKGFETTRTNERQVSPAKQGQVVEIFRLNTHTQVRRRGATSPLDAPNFLVH